MTGPKIIFPSTISVFPKTGLRETERFEGNNINWFHLGLVIK